MIKRRNDLIVKFPKHIENWIGVDELRQIRVDVVDPLEGRSIGRISLADLLHKTR
jgi:hypothetical protein